ncbi:hypothetical protein M434DRAFT_395765 [Hypoxylon sp. CO27-5]|nr:hypothetical protein M434DRAFT_395765 [Hypoxylon sp. CO27-5]
MLRYLHGISFRSFATSTGFFCLGFATESYFHRNKREALFHLSTRPVTLDDKMAIQNQVKTPFQVRLSIF